MTKRAGKSGVLVAIEGIDGAGKTTQTARIAEALERDGYEVVCTHEPTDGPHGRRLRASATTGRLSPEEELETFVADRTEHVATLIRPSLAAGRVVLVDRYYFSSMAYQGARGLDPTQIQKRNEAIAPRPDLLVILEVDAKVGVERVNTRGKGNLFEREDDLRRAARIFDAVTEPRPLRIDATLPREEITAMILKALEPLLVVETA